MSAAAQRPPRKEPLEPGRTVAGRYLVRRVLGQGGMGQVLEVEHVALGRAFALKVLRLERWNDELVRRFNREARALARVTTPRVAQVTDFGVDEDVGPFYVMELLEGETLEDRLEREARVPPRDALAICAELCEALAEVHAAGIVHRDLKPSNVGLPRSGPVGVKLLDFGLAASMDDAFLSKITQSQQILGSLPYMAPEQFNSAEPAPAMDVYAVGVVLYESLVGRLPFFAPSTAAMIHQILSTPPPPSPSICPGAICSSRCSSACSPRRRGSASPRPARRRTRSARPARCSAGRWRRRTPRRARGTARRSRPPRRPRPWCRWPSCRPWACPSRGPWPRAGRASPRTWVRRS
ncbi:MAG: serine/threonine protein kinase [Sandaracinaceae bacterium]|nr:serine/threonine protein kinase [Sandaracinaceae bacterium]